MGRKKDDLPTICRSGSSAVIHLNYQKFSLGPYGSQQAFENYHRIIAEWLASGKSKSYGRRDKLLTVKQLCDEYVEHCKEYYGTGNNSEVYRVGRVIKTLVKLYGSKPAQEFGVVQFKAVRQSLVIDGLARRNTNAMMKRLVRIFKWLANEGRLDASVPQALAMIPGLQRGRTVAREPPPVLPVDDKTVEATLPHLTQVVADMVRFHRLTGCRPAEVCMITPGDVDRSGEVWTYRPSHHKTEYLGKDRIIPVGPKAQEVLLPYLLRPAECFCFSPKESEQQRLEALHARRSTPLFCGNRPGTNRKRRRDIVKQAGSSYDPRSYRKAIYYACVKGGIKPWAPNRLRHAAATEIRKKFGLEAAQVVLGHSQANITQIYAERDQELACRVAAVVG